MDHINQNLRNICNVMYLMSLGRTRLGLRLMLLYRYEQ